MATICTIKRKYNKKIYCGCLKLLEEGKSCAEVGRIANIPRTTVRNWKLEYAEPHAVKQKRFSKKELKQAIKNIIDDCSSTREISKRLKCPYNSALLIIKKEFPDKFKEIRHKAHKLSEQQKTVTPELAYILGTVFGDGYCSGPYQVKLGVIDKEFRDYFAAMVWKWLGIRPKLHEYTRRSILYYEAHINSKDVRDFIFSFIRKRTMPREITQSSDKGIKCMFIKGFSDSEGSVNKRCIRIYNTNLPLLSSVRKLLKDVGFNPKSVGLGNHGKGIIYAIYIYPKNFRIFKEKIGFTIERKMNKLNEYTRAASEI